MNFKKNNFDWIKLYIKEKNIRFRVMKKKLLVYDNDSNNKLVHILISNYINSFLR